MKHPFWTLLTIAALLPGTSKAQDDTTDGSEVIPRYDVEIIIFKNSKAPKSREFVLPVSSPGKTEPMLDLASPASVSAARKQGYDLLPSSEFRLIDEAMRLVESPRYELLAHLAWRQPGVEREAAIPLWIRGGRIYGKEYMSIDSRIGVDGRPIEAPDNTGSAGNLNFDEQSLEALELQQLEQQPGPQTTHRGLYELEGKITIALSRYLHTYADLVLRRPRVSTDPLLNEPVEDEYVATISPDARILNNHSLREHRRMRSKTLHYLDNPEFGMLVLITPHEVAEGFEEAPVENDTGADADS